MKKLFQKTIALTYLTIFLFSLFIPFNQSFAQNATLVITIDNPNLKTGDTAKVTANSNKTQGGEIVSFSSAGNDDAFYPSSTCKMPASPQIQSCSVNFTPLNSFSSGILNASVTINNIIYKSNNVSITIVKKVTTPPLKQSTDTTYTPLAPLPGLETPGCVSIDGKPCIQTDPGCKFDEKGNVIPGSCTNSCPFGNYLNIIIKLILGIAAVLAMVMITMGGIEYMTSDLVSSKEAGKETIKNAILGLLIALGAYLILNTINPQLLSACLDKLPEAKITILPFDDTNSYVVKTSGSCKIITTGDCSPTNFKSLNIFTGKEEKASMVCSIESGGKADTKSFSDYCSEGKTTFSFGLFQINLLVHGDKIPSSVGNCKDLFVTTKGEDIGYGKKGYVVKDEKGNYSYDCKLKPDRGSDYARCSAYLKTASGNLNIASVLFKSRGLGDWKASDQKVCPAAFQ